MKEASISLLVRRLVHATPERLFAAWTEAAQLRQWWGPEGVSCPSAEVDLRVGGRYRIENKLPDGRTLWIQGEFEEVQPPYRLVYTWRLSDSSEASRVTVRFEPKGGGTEVVVVHERIPDEVTRTEHAQGWQGCLDGLLAYASSPKPPAA